MSVDGKQETLQQTPGLREGWRGATGPWWKGHGHLSSIQTESCKKKYLSFLAAARCALFGVLVGMLQRGVAVKNKDGPATVIYVREAVLPLPAAPHRAGSRQGTQLMYPAKHRPQTQLGRRGLEQPQIRLACLGLARNGCCLWPWNLSLPHT